MYTQSSLANAVKKTLESHSQVSHLTTTDYARSTSSNIQNEKDDWDSDTDDFLLESVKEDIESSLNPENAISQISTTVSGMVESNFIINSYKSTFINAESTSSNIQHNDEENQLTDRTAIDILSKEKEIIQNDLYISKGQIKIIKDQLNSVILAKNTEVNALKKDAVNNDRELKKIIESLKSQLAFKEAALQQNNFRQNQLELCSQGATDKTNRPNGIQLISPVKQSSKRKFFQNGKSLSNEIIQKKLKVSMIENQLFDEDIETIKTECDFCSSKKAKIEISQPLKILCEVPFVFKSPIESVTMEKEIFDYTTNTFDENEFCELLTFPEMMAPHECCTSVNYEKMYGWSINAIQILSSLLQSCMTNEIKDDESTRNSILEAIILMDLQLERLVVSMRRRRISIPEEINDNFIRKTRNRYEWLMPTDSHCLLHYIDPVSQLIDKAKILGNYYPIVASLFLTRSILPRLFEMSNTFFIEFCCNDRNREVFDEHLVENQFIAKLLRFALDVISQTELSKKDGIYEIIDNSFEKLIPFFAAKMNLKSVMIDLFYEMLHYTNFINDMAKHDHNMCTLFAIINLINCNCLEHADQDRIIGLMNLIARLVISMCNIGFSWDPQCACTPMIFSLISRLSLTLSLKISESHWTETNVECLKNVFLVYKQIKLSFGPEVYYSFSQYAKYQEFFDQCAYLLKDRTFEAHGMQITDRMHLLQLYSFITRL